MGGGRDPRPRRRARRNLWAAHLLPRARRPARREPRRHHSAGGAHRASDPGNKDLVVSHEPEHLLRKYQRPDLRNAIHEAFRIAQRRLRDLKEQREGRTKEPRHDSENQSLGQVVELTPDADHGFLLTKEGGLLYFHRNAVLIGDFDRLDRGDEVYYVEDLGDTGPIATKVRVKAES